jgi:uncharacterized glyoxalase superfamily protein PhnB
MTTATQAGTVRLWHTLSVHDADLMLAWLAAIGFQEHAVYRDEADPRRVVHAELLWPGGGGIMLGTVREDGGDLTGQPGAAAAYLVTGDPDAAFRAALDAGGRVLRPMVDQDYGGRGGSVADPEGNTWSFGDYQPG